MAKNLFAIPEINLFGYVCGIIDGLRLDYHSIGCSVYVTIISRFSGDSFLGLSKSLITVFSYLLIGIIGLPVFSGFRGGFAVVCGPIGGFLVGFIFMCLVSGLLIKLFPAGKMYRIIALGIGHICLYASGLIWFLWFTGNGSFDFDKLLVAFSTCVLPFILPDAVKIFLAEYLFSKLRFLTDGV